MADNDGNGAALLTTVNSIPANIIAICTQLAETLNGDSFTIGGEGEILESLEHRVVWVKKNYDEKLINDDGDRTQFILVNADRVLKADTNVSIGDAVRIGFLRRLAFEAKLFEPNLDPATKYCKHSEFAEYDPTVLTFTRDPKDLYEAFKNCATWMQDVKPLFYDIVCIVAYMFRTRGHHYLSDMNERYISVWRKCLYDSDNPGVKWEYVAHHALHAIYPIDLDKFFLNAVDENKVKGALKTRRDCAAAGTAGILALHNGVSDLCLVIPKLREFLKNELQYLEQVYNRLVGDSNRWNGSVNTNLYNAQQVHVNEAKLGPPAACVRSCIETFCANNPMMLSKSLERIANNAPLTGSMMAKIITGVIERQAIEGKMFEVKEVEQGA